MLRDELLKQNSLTEIKMLDKNPADYFFPYIRDSARKAASNCAYARMNLNDTHGDGITPLHWQLNQRNCRALTSSMNSLARFITYPEINSGAGSLKLRALLSDYAALIEETQVIGFDLQGHLQQQANSAAVEETKNGIAQADSVRREDIRN